jgi:hypothetical protein
MYENKIKYRVYNERQRSENVSNHQRSDMQVIPIRFTDEQTARLRRLAKERQMKIAEIIRLALDRLKI